MTYDDCAFWAAMREDGDGIYWDVWTMANGQQINVSYMSATHIKNALAMVKREDKNSSWIAVFERELAHRDDILKIMNGWGS